MNGLPLASKGIYKFTLDDIEMKGEVSSGIFPFFYTLTDNGN